MTNSRIITLGKEKSRYALIFIIYDRYTQKCIDDTITYYRSDDLSELIYLEDQLDTIRSNHRDVIFDISIYDYKEHNYL